MAPAKRTHEDVDASSSSDGQRHQRTKNVLSFGPHPLGIQPLGNAYMAQTASEDGVGEVPLQCRHRGLGTLAVLSDQDVLNVVMFLGYRDLCRLAAVSKALYVFAHHDELWKTLVLSDLGGGFDFQDSWKHTYRKVTRPELPPPEPLLQVRDFFSDLLFQPWYCASIGIKPAWVATENVDRRSQLSLQQFIDEYEAPNRPVIITDVVPQWPAYGRWNRESLLARYAQVPFTAAGFKFSLEQYFRMSDQAVDENPLYLFDARFGEKAPELAQEYTVPEYFREDLFSLLGDKRPKYRWLIIGPARSGSNFHQDPNQTSAWNAVVQGAKKWILFPPSVAPPGVFPSGDGAEVTSSVSLAEWFINFYDEAVSGPEKPLECVCRAGELIFVPRGWWHAVLNLEDDTIAITQNYVSRRNLLQVTRFLRDKPDQVSGFCDQETPRSFERLFRERYPGELETMEQALEARRREKEERKALYAPSAAATSFSFGFGLPSSS